MADKSHKKDIAFGFPEGLLPDLLYEFSVLVCMNFDGCFDVGAKARPCENVIPADQIKGPPV